MAGRIAELERLVRYHQDKYYNGEAEISDAEFDLLWDELRALAPGHAIFSEVGADATDLYTKRPHIIPMNSQEKAGNAAEFEKWAAKVGHTLFLAQLKLDGASLELQYREGALLYALTRGDGRIGDDITVNVRKMQGVPTRLPESFSGAVRGEVIMEHAVFTAHYADKANCRNAANGIMKRKDGVGADRLRVRCYDAWRELDPPGFADEQQKLQWLAAMGFDVVEYWRCETAAEVVRRQELVAASRSDLGFDIDGLVVKGLEIDIEDQRRARPQKQIAFKFSVQEAQTVLREVEWSESGHLYTPVAIVDPVQIAGTTVRRASLVHPELIAAMDLRIGSEVIISKRGDIIPKIERLLRNPAHATPIIQPEVCAECGARLVNEGKRLYCPNIECPKRAFRRLQRWIDVLEVKDFGDVLLRKLFDDGTVRTIADLYGLTVEQLSRYEGMGERSSGKALQNLREQTEIDLPRFVAGFDIEGIAVLKMAKVAAAGYNSLEALRGAGVADLAKVEGIGETTAQLIIEGLRATAPLMDAVLATGAVRLTPPIGTAGLRGGAGGGALDGKTFCFTGTLETMTRAEAQRLVHAAGGIVRTAVAAGLDYLVTNDAASGSTKARKARELGTVILNEAELVALLEQLPTTSAQDTIPAQ